MLTTAPILSYFDPTKPTKVSADASSFGLGGVLLQKHDYQWKPVAFCSRTLSSTEQKWAQIEKECLAAAWACDEFQQYLLGISFILQSDHKPLIPLLNNKELYSSPVRCQRLLMRLARFSLLAEYTPEKCMAVADALSRSPKAPSDAEEDSMSSLTLDIDSFVGGIIENLPVSSNQLQRIKEEQLKDNELKQVIELTLQGWPISLEEELVLSPYWAARSYLSVAEGSLLIYNDRIVIPKSMRCEILNRIHSDGHLSLNKCRRRAHDSVWWPNLGTELKTLVDNCSFCIRNSRQQRAEPLKTSPLPERPWLKIGMDLCFKNGSNFLVVVDYFSRWLEIIYLAETTSTYVISKLKNLFAKFGIPEIVVSDNGPQFGSAVFKQFSQEYGFQHYKSDPYFSQENGCAERAVQTAKRILAQDDVFMSLMTYRATPMDTTGYSPAQLLMGRQIRTRLPMLKSKLLPKWPALEKVAEADARMKISSAAGFNKRHGARLLPPIGPSNPVLIKGNNNKWDGNTAILKSQIGDRSYMIRNRRHIKALPVDIIDHSAKRKEPGNSMTEAGVKNGYNKNGSTDKINTSLENPLEVPGDAYVFQQSPSTGDCLEPRIVPSKGMITRSGRVCKPPTRLDL